MSRPDLPENGEPTYDEAEAFLGKRKRRRKEIREPAQTSWRIPWPSVPITLIASAIGVLFLGIGLVIYYSGPQFTEDPEEVLKIQREICHIDLPLGYRPAGGFRMSSWGRKRKMAMFQIGESSSLHSLIIIEYEAKEVTESQLEDKSSSHSNRRDSEFLTEQEVTKQITVEGQERSFSFATWIDKSDDGTESRSRMVSGRFLSKSGFAYLILTVPESDYDETAAIQLIESIHR